MNHFGDPGYKYHTLMSQLWGVTALRLANADLLPFDFATYAANIRQFVQELATKNKSVIVGEARAPRSEARAQSKAPCLLARLRPIGEFPPRICFKRWNCAGAIKEPDST